MAGSWDLKLVCLTSEPDAFATAPYQGGRAGASVFTCPKEEDPRPLETVRKAEGGVLPETKLPGKPS